MLFEKDLEQVYWRWDHFVSTEVKKTSLHETRADLMKQSIVMNLFTDQISYLSELMYQSIPSLTIPPGNFFDGRIPHPRAYKNELKPHPQGHVPQLFIIKTWKMRQKSRKTAGFYHL